MVETSRPDPGNGYVVSTDEWERMAYMFGADGVFGSPADSSIAYADSTGRQVKVRAAKVAMVRGYSWYSDPSVDQIISGLPANTSGNPRIDRLTLRLDRSTRVIRLNTIQGTPSATPAIPALTQSGSFTSGQWDFPLMRWNVANGYTTVAATDTTLEAWYPQAAGVILCNSTSRPQGAALLQGQRIYEYDTGYKHTWNGSKWIRDQVDIVVTSDAQWTSNTVASTIQAAGGATTPSGGFTVPVDANSRYKFELELQLIGQAGVGLAVTLNQPAGCRADDHIYGWAALSGGAWAASYNQNITAASSVHGTYQSGSARIVGVILVGSTPGSLTFTFAQGVSNGATSWLLTGSTMRVTQIS